MIIKNNSEVRKIYFGTSPAPMLNYNGSKAWQHIVDESSPSVDCPDVVQTMDGYDGDAKEVYAKDTKKWYMRNNLGNYEAYGVFATDITTATTYTGKLAKVGMSEYEFDGSDWVYVGEATGTTTVVRSPSYIVKDASHGFKIPLDYTASTNTKIQLRLTSTSNGGGAIFGDTGGGEQDDFRFFMSGNQYYFDRVSGRIRTSTRLLNKDSYLELGNYYIKNLSTGINLTTGTTSSYTRTSTISLGQGNSDYFTLSSLTIYTSSTLARDFIPAIDGNNICLYDKVSDTYFKSNNGIMPLSGGTITEVEVGTKTYPKDYEVKDAPEDNVTVESLDLIECPYEGMTAYVNGVKYTYENGKWLDYKDIYDIYGTLTGDSATATIQINGTSYSVSPSGSDNGFGLVFSQPVRSLSFRNQFKIKTLDKLNIDTSAMTNMTSMFYGCNALTSLDISNWDTSAVTKMSNMLNSCHALTNLNVSNFNTEKVTNMGFVFNDCNALTTLDLSNWDTSAVTNMANMFFSCYALTTLTMNNTNQTTFDTIKAQLVTDRVASHVTIIRDGVNWKYQNGEWVEA